MNVPPITWSAQLQAVYPARSGPCAWRSSKLLYACRAALSTSTWQEIIEGCQRYALYCAAAGKLGTDYVKTPLNFIEGGCYLETFTYKAPEDPKKAEAKRKEQERWNRALADGARVNGGKGIKPMPLESVDAYETRMRFAQNVAGVGHSSGQSRSENTIELSKRIAGITQRLTQ